ncbi:MAG: regulator, partial [Marinilabiliales bacterium]
ESLIHKINIYNSVGQEIIHIDNIEETQKTISVSKFEPGIYFIKIQTDNSTITKKLIKP